MHFVGIDLAWGERNPTGLAVLDRDGALVHVSTVRTDDQVVEALAPYTTGPCLVAVDAPLVVTNSTGNRPAEAALNADFARFDAGAHPSNTGKPEFRDGTTRGARLCARLGLDINPRSRRRRRGIEVYPHPATVALFRLGRTLKYKNKPGRTLEGLRSELLTLMTHLEGLSAAEPALHLGDDDGAWAALRLAATTASRKSGLREVEDQVDAVVAAYVALFAERRPQDTTTYGDGETGFIVTPALPEGLVPSPRARRSPPDHTEVVRDAVRAYTELQPVLADAAEQWVGLVTAVLDDAGINYLTVTGRAKSVASFAGKAARTVDGVPAFDDPLTQITDVIGLRVITYVHSDVDAVVDLLGDQVVVLDDRDMGRETASEGRFGYASRHLLVRLDPARESQPALAVLRGRQAQVQVRTVLQHAWAEFEHDIRYKGTIPDEHVPDLDRRFTLAAGLLELADREFSMIRDRLQAGMTGQAPAPVDDDPRISARELAAFLAGQYAEAGWSRTDHYAWISGLLLELGIDSLVELGAVLRDVDGDAVTARMGYRYPPGAVRRLDDALLAAFGERYVALRGNAHRESALRARLEKLSG
ncbi:bifunctional ribonuclease/(p)ppGpp synthase [Angustibacter speluncae]